MKKYIVELIGTFFLVFTIGMTVIAPGAGALAPLAIGAALMGLFSWASIWIYLVANLGGGVAAAAVFKLVNPPDEVSLKPA